MKELENSIHNVVTNPDQYIKGELFTQNAGNEIKHMYSVLCDNILLCIRKSN